MNTRVTYLIEIEKCRDEADFEGNGVPAELKPMTAMQLQKAIAYDLVRIRSADLNPFEEPSEVNSWYRKVVSHRPEFG